MISDISYCRVPTDLSVVHIPCYFCLGQLPKSLWAWSSFLLLFQKKLQSMKEEYEAMGFPWFSIVFPLRLSISVALLLGSRPGSKKRRKALRRMGFYLQRCLLQVLNETCASGCTSQLLHDSCATHWKPIPRNKLEAWQQCKRRAVWWLLDYDIVIVSGIVGGFCREFCLMFDQHLPCSTDSQCGEGIGEGEKQKRWVWGATKPFNCYCSAFIWFQTFHIAEFPLIWV